MILIILGIILSSYSIFFWCSEETVTILGMENSLFELSSALFFLIASILFFICFLRNKSIFLLLLSMAMFIGAGEELSWGQHYFHFSTPESIKRDNIQGEFNFHNLKLFNAGDEMHNKRSGWKRLLEINFLFRICSILFGIILPLLILYSSKFEKLANKIKLPVPPLVIGIFFLINWVAFRSVFDMLPKGKPDEPNTITFIIKHKSSVDAENQQLDAKIHNQIVEVLSDTKNKSIVKSLEISKKDKQYTFFDIVFREYAERSLLKSSKVYEDLLKIREANPSMDILLLKDDNYYSTSAEVFECIAAMLFMIISIGFYSNRKLLFKPSQA